MRKSGGFAAAAAVCAPVTLQVLAGGAASAATEPFTKTVSCSNGYYTNVRDWTQGASGSVSISQTSSNPQIVGQHHLQSSLGNNTGSQNIGDGMSRSFGTLLPAAYKTWHTAASSVNCNGISPGNGNSSTTGSVTHS